MPNANLVAAQNQLRNLVSIYNSNFDQYQQATYNETQVRVDFVNPFFQLLGWDVLNEAGLPQHLLTKLLFWLKKMVHIGAKSLIIPSKSEQKYFSF